MREPILIAASQLFAAHGYHATTTRDIAAAVGVKQPALFHHFSSKAEILEILQRADLLRAIELVRLAATTDPSPAVQLFVGVHQEVMHLIRGPYDYRGTTTPVILNDPSFEQARSWWYELQDVRIEIIRVGIDEGDFIEIDPTFANHVIESTIDGTQINISVDMHGREAEWADQLTMLVVRAIVARQSRLDRIRRKAIKICARLDADRDQQPTD